MVFIHLIPLSKIREQKDQESERMLQFLLHSFLDACNLHSSAGDGSGSSPSKPCIPFSKRRHGNVNVHLSILMSDASGLFFFNVFKFIFNGKILVLPCCVGFCRASTWISCKCTYILSSWACLLPRSHPTPVDHHRALSWVPWVTQQLPTSYLSHTR